MGPRIVRFGIDVGLDDTDRAPRREDAGLGGDAIAGHRFHQVDLEFDGQAGPPFGQGRGIGGTGGMVGKAAGHAGMEIAHELGQVRARCQFERHPAVAELAHAKAGGGGKAGAGPSRFPISSLDLISTC